MAGQIRALPPPQPLLPATQNQPPPQPSTSDQFLYKNRLQQYTGRLSLPLPVYSTVNEGTVHAPMFRCTVVVDNASYTTENVYSTIKSAEHDVAKLAFEDIMQKVKDEGSLLIREDPIYCKAILNEYANKKGFHLPTYESTQQQEGLQFFISSLVFNGHPFTGPAARTKKEAEQLAARVAILSILGTPGIESATMSNIVKAKYQLYIASKNVNGSDNKDSVVTPMITDGERTSDSAPDQGKQIVSTGVEVVEHRLEHVAMVPAPNQPIHEFKKQKVESSTASTALMAPQIAFVPPVQELPPVQEPPPGAGPSSAKKRRKKGKNHLLGAQSMAISGADFAYLSNIEASGGTRNLPVSTVDLPSTAVIRNPLNQSASIHIASQPLQKLVEATKHTPNLVPIPPPVAFVPQPEEQHSGACPGLSAKRRKKRKKNQQQPGAQFPCPVANSSQLPGLVHQ